MATQSSDISLDLGLVQINKNSTIQQQDIAQFQVAGYNTKLHRTMSNLCTWKKDESFHI